jgi:hypothetical protein
MSEPDKEKASTQREPSRGGPEEVTFPVLSTAACAVCFLVAFTFLRGTEQLLLASLGGLLIGGAK